MMKYVPEFKRWYKSLDYRQYRDHYMAWRSRDVCAEQERIVKDLVGNKHFPIVYDMSYGGGEFSRIISHDRWIKTITDDKQQQLVGEITPTAELSPVEYPTERQGGIFPDLILAMNVLRSVKGETKDIYYMWQTPNMVTPRSVIFDMIVSDKSWVGMNDATMNKKKRLSFLDRHGILPRKYWEFPHGVEWYIGYHSTDIKWLPKGKEVCGRHGLELAALAAIDYIYTDISNKTVLDLSYCGLGDTPKPEQVINLPQIHEHYDIVLGIGLLSRIEQFDAFVKHVISSTDADVYIFSGKEGNVDIPTFEYIDDQVSLVAHPYQTYSLSELYIKHDFDYNTYLMRGPTPEDLAADPRAYYGKEIYLVVEAAYQIPETIVRTKCCDSVL